jgi:energy-coupling factor transporter ATP-binding protein EcfA2
MLKLRRLRVERFRSLARGTEFSFSDGINVLLGQNGTGKTTLLELISMVVRSDFSTLAKEEFAIEYELSVPEGESIIIVVRNDRVAIEQPQRPAELGQREAFRPSAEVFGGADRRLLLRYDAEHGISGGEAPAYGPAGILAPVDPGFLCFLIAPLPSFSRAYFRHLVQAGNAYRLDESLDLFRRITSLEDTLGHVFVNEGKWVPYPFSPPFVPDSVVQKLMVSHEPKKPDYSLTDDNLSLLATLKEMMGFTSSELHVVVTEQRTPPTVQIGNLVFRFWWEDGTFITHERLSYGQKRLVAFFYYIACNPDIVIADELVNGLHHRWITASIDAIGPRQAFLTSQNPLLLDYVAITSAEEARRSFVLCRTEPRPGARPGWIWENMSAEDAAELFSAYGVGVEHVSEILQSRGLW